MYIHYYWRGLCRKRHHVLCAPALDLPPPSPIRAEFPNNTPHTLTYAYMKQPQPWLGLYLCDHSAHRQSRWVARSANTVSWKSPIWRTMTKQCVVGERMAMLKQDATHTIVESEDNMNTICRHRECCSVAIFVFVESFRYCIVWRTKPSTCSWFGCHWSRRRQWAAQALSGASKWHLSSRHSHTHTHTQSDRTEQ